MTTQLPEAFVYCWTDHRDNKLYVGWHKGSQNDGYICSQDHLTGGKIPMLQEYRKRPQDFTRTILAEGSVEDCRALEETILVAVGAARSKRFYNQHNGGKNFAFDAKGENNPMYGKHHTEKTRKEISGKNKGKRRTEETLEKMRKPHGPFTEEHNKKISDALKGKPKSEKHRKNLSKANIGKKAPPEVRAKMTASRIGKHHSEDTREKMRESARKAWIARKKK